MWLSAATLTGCANSIAGKLQLIEPPTALVLNTAIETAHGRLAPGVYRCRYRDDEGDYCEAPATLNGEYVFHRGSAGGIYVRHSEPAAMYVYSQDKHPSTVYAHGIGMVTWGGTGGFNREDRIPTELADQILIKER